MKKFSLAVLALALIFAGYLVMNAVDAKAPAAMAKGKTYSGMLYVAGMGGHFAGADVEIDPSAAEPIKVKNLDKVDIGDKATHPVHDARIDVNDTTKMYWSTYKIDKAKGERTVHVGLTDLKTGKVISDVPIDVDAKAKWTGAVYCASGQSKTAFIPVTMTGEAYIDVLEKGTLKLRHRVFLDSIGYAAGSYWFYHGVNSPDMKVFAVSINKTSAWEAPDKPGKPNGEIDIVLLDLPALEKGELKVIKKATFTGTPGKTLTFRQTFTPDNKTLLQSAGDRLLVIDAKSLKLKKEVMVEGENHDAMPTPDGKYAILTIRRDIRSDVDPEGKTIKDGLVQLYDIAGEKLVGQASSTCYSCHRNANLHGNAILCGLDGNLK